jgi:hypothetical protein
MAIIRNGWKLMSARCSSNSANAAFVGPDLDPDVGRPAERAIHRFQHITGPDLFGPFQETPAEKEKAKRLHCRHQRFGALKVQLGSELFAFSAD